MKLLQVRTENKTFYIIQIARWFAALLVVADHALLDFNGIYFPDGSSVANQIAWRIGSYGVYIFFVISGFVITYGHLGDFSNQQSCRFLLKRFIRVVPLYWLVTILYAAKHILKGAAIPWSNFAASMLFVPFGCFHNTCGRPVLELGWTLQFEVFFYLAFALCLNFNRKVGLLVLLGGLLIVAITGFFKVNIGLPIGYYFSPILIYFLLGVLLGLFVNTDSYQKFTEFLSRASTGKYLLLLACIFGICIYGVAFIAPEWLDIFTFSSIFIVLVLCLRDIPSKFFHTSSFKSRVMSLFLLFGTASYSLYLTHIFILGSAARLVKSLSFHIPFLVYFLVAAILTSLLAVLSYWIIEKPSQKILKRLFHFHSAGPYRNL